MAIRKSTVSPFRAPTSDWTAERIDKLDRSEIEQLRSNAIDRGADNLAELCASALAQRPKRRESGKAGAAKRPRRLVSRGKAFEARGVYLQDARTSWGGIRKSDGTVVLSLWADAVQSTDGTCSYLLWAPDTDGTRPWFNSAPGQERLKHCQMALGGGMAEGLLVFGQALEGRLPEEKARSVHGVDPDMLVHFTVEKRGEEFWAIWGKRN
ncbi:MAG TPA: hypothetical protein VM183_00770 [Burkholderiales bacterium]|nr:hypothetical protein [Burkholderiales bacterium]